jgi:hypothetical protein
MPATLVLLVVVLVATGACAVHYYDPSTGTEHVWGVGHMAMKVSPPGEGLRAVVRGTSALGLSAGRLDAERYVTLGWSAHRRLEIVDDDTSLRLECPEGSWFRMRVGSAWPDSSWPVTSHCRGDQP